MVTPTVNINGQIFTEGVLQTTYLVVKELNISDNVKEKVLQEITLRMLEAKQINLFED